jgi:hypothetical protein
MPQALHFSISYQWKPRNRGWSAGGMSGYCKVTVRAKQYFRVICMPMRMVFSAWRMLRIGRFIVGDTSRQAAAPHRPRRKPLTLPAVGGVT